MNLELRRAWVLVVVALVGCEPSSGDATMRGVEWLIGQQAADGAFRADSYGVLRPGRSSTALALLACAEAPEPVRVRAAGSIERGLAFLVGATPDGDPLAVDTGAIDYPTYTAAQWILVLDRLRPAGYRERIDALAEHLRGVQLVEHNGWSSTDPVHGAFGIGDRPRPRPEGAELAGISTTAWAVEALRVAGEDPDGPCLRAARGFVERCQDLAGGDGFAFSTGRPEYRGKAGADGERIRPYGTTTADGVRALRALQANGAGADDPRLVRALAWLRTSFRADRVPGFAADHAAWEEGLRMYWLCVAPRALSDPEDGGRRDAIGQEILRRQRADGSWIGDSALMKEDDPMLATALALLGLDACR